jgi:photosystem II stability/assembly factor-like uncharacterized protein
MSHLHTRARLAAGVALILPALLGAQGAGRQGGGAAPTAADTSYSVQWRNIGPLNAGRSVAVAGSTARPTEYYIGSTGGGVFKSTDGGRTADAVTDDYFGGTIGAIAIQQSNPDVVWVGGGETPIRGNVSHGDGVWRTTDGAKTWQYMGLKETRHISRIRIHPTNPDIVYIGALGHVFGPNAERGVFKTTDGGRTWNKILFRNDSTGITDLILDPSNPDIIYAAFWQAGRKPWLLISGGAGSGIMKSTDAGRTWTEITRNPGLPATGPIGNIGITVSPANPRIVWALIEHESGGGMYKSSDAGATWTFMNGNRNIRQRAWYYTRLFADPVDTNLVYTPNVSMLATRDGGRTLVSAVGGGDNHDMWIDPTDPKRYIVAHDNGAVITTDWTNPQATVRTAMVNAQYYHVHLTNHVPYHVCGAEQDGSSVCGPVRTGGAAGGRGGGGGAAGGAGGRGGAAGPAAASPWSEFYGVAGGESGYISSDPLDPDITYGANYGGSFDMRNRRTGLGMSLDIWPLNPMGHDAQDSKYRFQWTFPIVHSPHDPKTIYVGSNVVFKSTDGGLNFTAISPDLTKADKSTLGPSGGPITKDQTSVEYYATVFTLSESPLVKGLIWTGSDDGLIHITRDGGKTWKNVTPPGLKPWMRMSIIEASPHAPGTAYVAGNRYQLDDLEPYLYRTTDYGATWTRITDGIPSEEFTRAIREDLHRPGMLYAATERSMYVSYDAGRSWKSLRKNLPPVPVHDIALRDDDMAIATHGRGFWVMENLTPLRWEPELQAAGTGAFLYTPAPVVRYGGNAAVTLVYRLPDAAQPVKFEFLDAAGKVLATAASNDTATAVMGGGRGGGGFGGGAGAARPTNRAGLNRYNWTMRYPGPKSFAGMINWTGNGTAPAMPPGKYTVRMTVGSGAPVTTQFVVQKDPRVAATEADLVEQARFAVQIRDRVTATNEGVIMIRNIERDLEARGAAMTGNAAWAPLVKAFGDSLNAVEDSLYQTKNQSGQDPLNYPIRINDQMAGLLSFVAGGGDRRPTKQSYEVFALLNGNLTRELARLDRIVASFLPRVNAQLKAAGQAEIVTSKDERPRAPGAPGEQDILGGGA